MDDVTNPDRLFEAQRPRLLRLAYRMLGSFAEAEDVVQDAWLRWHRSDRGAVADVSAYLSRIVTRLCLDQMKSARARRETYVGSWLPEPLIDDTGADDDGDLTLTLMLALERLSPLERAAFLLHDVFGVPMDEIAATLDRDAAAVRQLAARARKHVQAARPRFPVAPDDGARIAKAFFVATQTGDLAALQALLAEDVVMRSDGGGKIYAFINPIVGADRVMRMYEGILQKPKREQPTLLREVTIDGLPGYVSVEYGAPLQTTAFAIADGRIKEIYIMRNPDKLQRVARSVGAPA